MDTNQKLTADNSPKTELEKEQMIGVPYQETTGLILYINQITWPYISFATNF